jgi:type IV pilus assembly protein PilA
MPAMRPLLRRHARAFTLIELMIVVAIVGILAAVAVQDFLTMQCRAKQAEARPNLRAILTLQEQFRAEHDQYGCVNDASCPPEDVLEFTPKGKTRYAYFAAPTGPQAFYGEAAGVSAPLTGDLWTISEADDVQNVANACQ